jgi:hypothetical protein
MVRTQSHPKTQMYINGVLTVMRLEMPSSGMRCHGEASFCHFPQGGGDEWICRQLPKQRQKEKQLTYLLRGLSPQAKYTDRATAACRRSWCQLLRIEGATWSAGQIPTAVFSDF